VYAHNKGSFGHIVVCIHTAKEPHGDSLCVALPGWCLCLGLCRATSCVKRMTMAHARQRQAARQRCLAHGNIGPHGKAVGRTAKCCRTVTSSGARQSCGRTAKALSCCFLETHGKNCVAGPVVVGRSLSYGVARQTLCRATSPHGKGLLSGSGGLGWVRKTKKVRNLITLLIARLQVSKHIIVY
jgi:hypothetical protein